MAAIAAWAKARSVNLSAGRRHHLGFVGDFARNQQLDKQKGVQGGQFTGEAFTEVLKDAEVAISMDGKGRFMDNIFIERLWRSMKYEEAYLKAYDTVADAKAGIGAWISFYNQERLHQALGYRTPAQVFAGAADPVDMTLCLRQSLDNVDALPTYPQATTTTGFQLS